MNQPVKMQSTLSQKDTGRKEGWEGGSPRPCELLED